MLELELLSQQKIDAVRAIHREDIPESWVDAMEGNDRYYIRYSGR